MLQLQITGYCHDSRGRHAHCMGVPSLVPIISSAIDSGTSWSRKCKENLQKSGITRDRDWCKPPYKL